MAKSKASKPPLIAETAIPTIGDSPLEFSKTMLSDQAAMTHFMKKIVKGHLPEQNPWWNDTDEMELKRAVSFGSTNPTAPQINWNDRFAKRHPIADLNIPRNPDAVLSLCYRYAQENPFVNKAIRVKTQFTCKNFSHKTVHETSKKFFDNYATRLHLKTLVPRLAYNLYSTGVSPVYWGGEDGGPIRFIQVLDPRMVQIQEILGTYKLWLKITQEMIDAVNDPEGKEHPKNKALFVSMPPYWTQQIQKAIASGKAFGLIELQDGSYAVVDSRLTIGSSINNFSGTPIQPIFDALQRYRLLAAGDFAVAWSVKNMITLISEGDPKSDPKNYFPMDNVRISKLMAQFEQPDYALMVYCDPTTQVRYIIPPIEVFDPKKYAQVEKEIKEALNLPSFMWHSDDGGTYGDAVAELKLLREEVDYTRLVIEEQFFRPLYERLRGSTRAPGFAASDICLPSFANNSLQDDALWLQASKEVYQVGAMSLRSLCETYGLDYDYEMAELKREHKEMGTNLQDRANTTPAQPLFEPSQGNSPQANTGEDEGGRPSNPSSEPKPGKLRSPRTKGK